MFGVKMSSDEDANWQLCDSVSMKRRVSWQLMERSAATGEVMVLAADCAARQRHEWTQKSIESIDQVS